MSAPPRWRGTSPAAEMLNALMNDHLDPGYAQAARRRLRAQPPGRLTARTLALSTALVLAVAGLILATAFRQAVLTAPDDERAKAGLVADVTRKSTSTDQLQADAERLRSRVTAEREAALAGSDAGRQTAGALRGLEAAMGLRPVAGPGVVVTVGDGPPSVDAVTGEVTGDADNARIGDRDLQRLVNALWLSGAEAIAIDGQRLTPTSAIRLAGEAILVDLRPISNPYTIEAIGEPGAFAERFGRTPIARDFRSYVTRYTMTFEVSGAGSLALPAASAPVVRHARGPAQAGRPASASLQPRAPGQQPGGPVPATPSATGGTR